MPWPIVKGTGLKGVEIEGEVTMIRSPLKVGGIGTSISGSKNLTVVADIVAVVC